MAYACSFRITEAVYLIERLVDVLALDQGWDPAELRMKNLLRPEQFPYRSPLGWEYDSGDYPETLRVALEMAGYDELRREQAERRAAYERGEPVELMGIGLSFFTEAVGAGPRKTMDILGLGMADGAELRVHPTGKAVLRLSCMSQGQGHETTFAQIVAEELGISPDDIEVVQGDTDQTPFGLGTYGSRSTPVSGGGDRDGGPQGPGAGADRRRGDAGGVAGRPGVGEGPLPRRRATRRRRGRSPRSRWPRTPTWSCPRASRATWTPPASTTRPT